MKISELLHTGNITFSCEIFPPKPGADISRMWEVVQGIAELSPDFISVTYGAGGSTSKRTEEIAVRIQEQHHIPALAHLTCVSSTREDIRRQLASFQEKGIENILALRGDIPQDSNFPVGAHYQHAYELIQDIKSQGDFCIGGACYPEGHVECESREEDIDHLKQKMECGCDFFTTQMFFDNNMLYNFLYRTLAKGIEVPIIAGIMPVTNARTFKAGSDLDWEHPVEKKPENPYLVPVIILAVLLIALGAACWYFFTTFSLAGTQDGIPMSGSQSIAVPAASDTTGTSSAAQSPSSGAASDVPASQSTSTVTESAQTSSQTTQPQADANGEIHPFA